MSFRAVRRAVALGMGLVIIILRYWRIRARGPLTLEQRAQWLHGACSLVLRSLGIHYRVEGQPPAGGLVVANHLSYLDIIVLSAAVPCFFISKAEIKRWPYFGWAARTGGTLFIDRSSLTGAQKVANLVAERLALPVPILFFPEGTSSDGSSVLRFHSWLFEPAVRVGAPVTAAAVRYIPVDSTQERELCWFGDDAFLPHLWKMLSTRAFSAEVQFGEPHVYSNRRIAAEQTRAEITTRRNTELVTQ
jgi:1-acyl-sn-glycerol-3-phosphate acyltransferase